MSGEQPEPGPQAQEPEDRFGGIFLAFVVIFTLVLMVGGC